MSHYLGYVYGPKTKEELDRVMRPYNEQYDRDNGALRDAPVLLENIPVMTLETTLFDMITEFRKISDKASFDRKRPILLVDDALDYLDIEAVREMGAFIISYDLDSKKATAKVIVSRAFWDWWVVGGRWENPLKRKERGWSMENYDIIKPYESQYATEEEKAANKKLRDEGFFTSMRFGAIDWKQAKKEAVAEALALHEKLHAEDPNMEPGAVHLKRLNLPKGARYYNFNHEEYDKWQNRTREIAEKLGIEWMYSKFSPFDICGMRRREVIRYALARVYAPKFGIFVEETFNERNNGLTSQTFIYSFDHFEYPTDQECKELLRRVKRLPADTVVTAIDIHN